MVLVSAERAKDFAHPPCYLLAAVWPGSRIGAGAVLHATGRRDFDGLGGLIHRMPVTAAFWLIGAMSISALPPFNGFVSEWLLFQAVLAGPAFPEPILRFMSPAVGAMLALAWAFLRFRALRPHSWRNPADEPARAVWLVVRAS